MARDPRARAIVEEILRRRSELNEEQVWGMIYKKMEEVGAGYLTEVGAGYLVASELGVDLMAIPQSPLRLAELKPGMRRVDVRALYLRKGRELSFEGKGGGPGKAYEYYLFDVGTTARLVIWGDPDFRRVLDTLKPGDALKIAGSSVKEGRDGGLEVHVDSRGNVDLEQGQGSPPGDPVETITLTVDEVSSGSRGPLVVRGKLASPVYVRSYERNGEERVMSYFTISDEKGQRSMRAVLWGQDGGELQELGAGSEIRLIGVRVREGRAGGLEVHGDVGTIVEVLSRSGSASGAGIASGEYLLVSSDFSSPGSSRAEAIAALGDQLMRLTALGDAAPKLASMQPGSLIRIKGPPTAAIEDQDDLEMLGQRPEALEKFRASVKDLEGYPQRICVFDGILLSKPVEKEVTSRAGEQLRLATALIGDSTGEVEIGAWRDQAGKLLQLNAGDRVRVFGAAVIRREGRPPSLDVRGYTRLSRADAGRVDGFHPT